MGMRRRRIGMELKPQISPIDADLGIDLKASRKKDLRQLAKSAV
jgi:hypothetical protein